jgi:hypothetical protein
MKALYILIVLIASTAALAQRTFKAELEDIFFNIPVDSSFEKLSSYARHNGFTYIDDKSMDSSGIIYVRNLHQKEIYRIPLVSSYLHLNYSDSLFVGDTFFKNSYSISYRIKLHDYKSLKKVYNKLLLKFSKVCRSKEKFKKQSGWTDIFEGTKFYSDSVSYPILFLSYSLTSFGNTVTVAYLRTNTLTTKNSHNKWLYAIRDGTSHRHL